MERPEWTTKHSSNKWLNKFLTHPSAKQKIPFVQFCSIDNLISENQGIEKLTKDQRNLFSGRPSENYKPGDIDLSKSYLIGFTDYCDAGIFVDLRSQEGPKIVYDNLNNNGMIYATAFNSVDEFIDFYNS